MPPKKKKRTGKTTTDARGRARNYGKEYDRDHADKAAKNDRADRNKARARAGLKKGDGKEVDHKKPLSKGGSNTKKNTRVVSRKVNRTKGAKG